LAGHWLMAKRTKSLVFTGVAKSPWWVPSLVVKSWAMMTVPGGRGRSAGNQSVDPLTDGGVGTAWHGRLVVGLGLGALACLVPLHAGNARAKSGAKR